MSPKAERISRSLTQNQTPDGLLHRLRRTPGLRVEAGLQGSLGGPSLSTVSPQRPAEVGLPLSGCLRAFRPNSGHAQGQLFSC